MKNLAEDIRNCHEHAAACRRDIATASSDGMKAELHRLERTWEGLARGYEFTQQMLDLTRIRPSKTAPLRTRRLNRRPRAARLP
jgi:hypothetical protein